MKAAPENKLESFLAILAKGKEVGLVIARDESEAQNLADDLEGFGFTKSPSIAGLFESPKTFMRVDGQMDKNVYDFMAQYPTGQIEIFDDASMQSLTFEPDYLKQIVVILVNIDDLNVLSRKGLDLRSVAGPAYQS